MFISGMFDPAILLTFDMKKFAYLKYIKPDKLTARDISIKILDAFCPRFFSMRRLKPQAAIHCAIIRKTYLGSPHA